MKALLVSLCLVSPFLFAASRLPVGPQAKLSRVTADGTVTWSLKCSTGVSADLSTRCTVAKLQDGILVDKTEIPVDTAEALVTQFWIRTRTPATASESAPPQTGQKVFEWKVSLGEEKRTGTVRHGHGELKGLEKSQKLAALALEQALDWELMAPRLKRAKLEK